MNMTGNKPLSVSQLSDILKACFENPMFSSLSVYGEVYSIKLGKFSYIELGDQGHKETNSPILKCAFNCYYGNDFALENIKVGDVIEITGSLSYYPHGSSLTLWGKKVNLLQSQLGKSLLEKKKTLEKLEKLGYLDEKRKRPIPRFCKRVAILTAANGAAYQDILKTLHDRYPVSTVLYPTVVQGESAKASIVKQMARATKGDYDVIILGRGGGSKTDLSCFDDEKVALAIATSPIPVITCIGHTIDTAIADRVSDAHAITPTEGASLINPSLEDINSEIQDANMKLNRQFNTILQNEAFSLEQKGKRLESLSPLHKLSKERAELKNESSRLDQLYINLIQSNKKDLSNNFKELKFNYNNILSLKEKKILEFNGSFSKYDPSMMEKNGYALILKDGKKIKSVSELKSGDKATITLTDGRKETIIQ